MSASPLCQARHSSGRGPTGQAAERWMTRPCQCRWAKPASPSRRLTGVGDRSFPRPVQPRRRLCPFLPARPRPSRIEKTTRRFALRSG